MGFFYRKYTNFGPFRVNLSKAGVGYSVGGRGFRGGRSSRERKYSAFSLPGNGLGYRAGGCLVLITAVPATVGFTAGFSPHSPDRLMTLTRKRTPRTPSFERFLAQRGGNDVAAVDLHCLANGALAYTVIILKGSGLDESNIEQLLSSLDEEFLPDVDLAEGNLTYTVVLGEVLGNWEASNAMNPS